MDIVVHVPDTLVSGLEQQAAERGLTPSQLMEQRVIDSFLTVLEPEYRQAYEDWKRITPVAGFNVEDRLSRDEANARR